MRILIVEGPGTRPAAYARVLGDALKHLGHRSVVRPLGDLTGSWSERRDMARVAGVMLESVRPDIVHALTSETWVAEAFVDRGVPVVHTAGDRPSRADWVVAPSRVGLDRIAGAGEGLDYRVGLLPYAAEIHPQNASYGRNALAVMDPADAEAGEWLEEAAWSVPWIPISDSGDPADARFVISVSSRPAAWQPGIAEAMTAGRPVIATWGGAAPEFVREAVTGYLSAPGDVESLVKHMDYLWDRPEQARRMGREAQELAFEFFDPEAHARTLLRWYLRAGVSRLAV